MSKKVAEMEVKSIYVLDINDVNSKRVTITVTTKYYSKSGEFLFERKHGPYNVKRGDIITLENKDAKVFLNVVEE